MGSYSREGYLALKQEVTENTAVTPDVFVPLMSEDITTEWGSVPAIPVSGKRQLNLRSIPTAIAPPSGTLNILAEPKTLGWFLKGVYGTVTSGQLMKMTGASGDWAAGDTVTGVSSSQTATVVAYSSEEDYLLVSGPSGLFTDGETIGNGSTGTGVLTQHDATVYGHEYSAPQASLPTFTIEIGFAEKSYRYMGVRFNALDSIAQADNMITLGVGVIARSQFLHARVTAITTSGAGAKTLSLDQTTGLVVADTIKVFRPSTGAFLDFSAASVKTHAVASIPGETSITVTNLETSVAVGDLLMLAPQTPSYTIDKELSWIGGSVASIATTLTAAITTAGDCFEDFEMVLTNEVEPRHCADGVNVVDRFPGKHFLKGLTGTGSLTRVYDDDTYLDMLRNQTAEAIYINHTGDQIGSTEQFFGLDWRTPSVRFDAFNPPIAEDDLLEQEMPFTMYDSTVDGFFHKALLTNDITAYT